ncbi:ankyrin repeat-containing protein ITN1-like [Cornus florida]|uniref:ankyrin repeat-containing protein ITN1-like n=1 Tax=Cornus florida TaxID=4283 RepID=UPI0028A0D22C|nr:ankyrin repeat-containing protein ITN1-like [Cornus florida]
MIFSETHKELMIEGEKWLKDNANSCTIVTALVITIVFAAVITVPGGFDNNNGFLILSKDKAFTIFIISDVLAFLSSTSFLLMFLSIITSRFSVIDFLHALPTKFIIGLVSLVISIIFMMVAFGAAFYLVFREKTTWIFASISALSVVPVSLFAYAQFPLLVEMIGSTYGVGILDGLNLIVYTSSR